VTGSGKARRVSSGTVVRRALPHPSFVISHLIAGCAPAGAIRSRTCRRGWAGYQLAPRRGQAHRTMTLGKLTERPPARREGCRSLTRGGAHTVLPLYPGIMIRRSNGCSLGTALALISPSPAPEPFHPAKSLGRDDRIVGQGPLQRLGLIPRRASLGAGKSAVS
jgi:hypothetical protein